MGRQGSVIASASASVSTPTSVAWHHNLAPPPCRFPRNSVHEHWGRRDSYGFPKVQTPSSMTEQPEETSALGSDETLVASSNEPIPSSRASSRSSKRIVRESSKVYTSFPRPTSSPWSEEVASPEGGQGQDGGNTTFFGRLLQTSTSKKRQRNPSDDDEEAGIIKQSGADTYGTMRRTNDVRQDQRPGIPKVTRECLISEIKCYGSSIAPVILVFGVLVLLISLSIYWHATNHQ